MAARAVAAWAPVFGLIPKPCKPPGLSAIVRVKDEETWLEPCIRSIATVADEVIVGDNGSTDRSLEILRRLELELGGVLRLFECGEVGIKQLSNHLLEQTQFRWVIRWDADFVAHTEGPQSIQILRDWLDELDERRYYMVYPRMVELAGDLSHQRPLTSTRADCHCFTSSEAVRYVYGPSGFEAPKIPISYGACRFEVPTFFHVDVKPDRRMFLSHVWKEYLLAVDRADYETFEAYINHTLQQEWRSMEVDEAAQAWAADHFRGLVRYDEERFGAYPALLQPHLEKPRFRIQYAAGQISGRAEADPGNSDSGLN
jgi:glycosyltransferase involved in cell wall biosynthesis